MGVASPNLAYTSLFQLRAPGFVTFSEEILTLAKFFIYGPIFKIFDLGWSFWGGQLISTP